MPFRQRAIRSSFFFLPLPTLCVAPHIPNALSCPPLFHVKINHLLILTPAKPIQGCPPLAYCLTIRGQMAYAKTLEYGSSERILRLAIPKGVS